MVWLNIQFQKGNGSRQFCVLSLSVSTSYQHICLSARLSLSGLPHYSTAYFKKMCNFRSKVTLSLKLKQQRICDNSTIMIVYPHKNCIIANSHPDSFAPPPHFNAWDYQGSMSHVKGPMGKKKQKKNNKHKWFIHMFFVPLCCLDLEQSETAVLTPSCLSLLWNGNWPSGVCCCHGCSLLCFLLSPLHFLFSHLILSLSVWKNIA